MSSKIANARRLLTAAICAFGISSASAAFAQESPKVAAEALFAAGQQQMDAQQYPEACKSFTESQKLDPSVGTLLNLGLCNEKQGKTASAWAAYKEAAQLAATRGDKTREDAARGFAAKLEPTLSRLTVNAKNAVPGLIVRRDGIEVGGLGLPLAIDPGEHEIEALAPGHQSWKTKVTIGANADQQTLEIPPLEKGTGEIVAPGTGGGSKSDGTPLVIAGFVVGGVGVAGLAVGTAFGVIASNTTSNAEDDPTLCPDRVCTPAGREEIDKAETQATISTAGLVVGGVALAGGVVLVVIGFSSGGSSEESPTAFYSSPELTIAPHIGSVPTMEGSAATWNDGAVFGVSGAF